jgi:hypothetical protein
MRRWRVSLLLWISAQVVGCSNESTGPGTPIISRLTCAQPTGPVVDCDLVLESTGGFRVMLTGAECVAHGNTLRLTKPVSETLNSDGCYAPVGTEWAFPGPYAAGTPISIEVGSASTKGPPALRVSGAYPKWTINFEDGSDSDFNDLVLDVEPIP